MEQYHKLEMIGEGSFGRVYKGRRQLSRQVVALKFIPKVGRSERELQNLKKEIEIMRGLKHPHIILLLDSFETESEIVIVTEYAEGELFQILEDDGCLPESQVRTIACQLVSALYYLHSNRILHRDMKPQNILLGKGVVKLCDFGFARSMSVSTLVLTSIKGTPLYMSPELVEEKPYDHTSDLWSLGCILYELHTGEPPFYTNSIFHLVQLIIKGSVKWPENMSEHCKSFLKGLLTKDPEKRLTWPDLLKHPFVADGVIVLSEESSNSPLTILPSPEVQALKQQQAAKKTVPRSGEGKLLRRAKEQLDVEQKNRQDSTESRKAVCSSQPRSKTAPAGEAPTSGHSLGSTFTVCRNSSHPAANQHQANGIGVARPRLCSAPCKGIISRDYEREFPSVEVGPRQVLKRSGHGHITLASDRMDSDEQDADSDEEWQGLEEVTDWPNQMSVPMDPPIHQKLKSKLHRSKDQILASDSQEVPSSIVHVLKLLSNIIQTSKPADARSTCGELDLPHFIFNRIEEMLSSAKVMKKPWSERILGELMAVLLVGWEKNPEWEIKEKRAEDLCQLFMAVLLQPDPNRLIPLAAAVLSLFAQRKVCMKIQMDTLAALLESLLSSPNESYHPMPAGWGMCDGVLALTHQFLSEDESSGLCDFLNSECWGHLWTKVCAMLQNTASRAEVLSDNGLYILLSLALFAFSSEPYNCVELYFEDDKKLIRTLSLLLTADSSTELKRGLLWGSSDTSSLPMMSCHLLCFPFSLELPQEKMTEILHSYQSLNVVTGLVQVIQTQSLALFELPLSLLCRLCHSSPQCAVPNFTKAALACGFLPQSAQRHPETQQTLNHLKTSGSAEERPKHNGFQQKNMSQMGQGDGLPHPKGGADMVRGSRDKSRGMKDPPNVQSQLSKSKSALGKLREKGEQSKFLQKVLTEEHLLSGIEQHSSSVEELLDSLELHDGFSHLRHLPSQQKRSMSWLIDSLEQPLNSVAHNGGDRGCSVISEIKGQSLQPVVRTASSILSELLQSESFCGSATLFLILLSQTAISASVLPVDPPLLRLALGHCDDGVRAAACALLAQLEPNYWVSPATGTEATSNWTIKPSLFQDLLSCLSDPAPNVRRIACNVAVKWLSWLGQNKFRKGVCTSVRDQHLQDGPKARKRTGSGSGVEDRGKRGLEAEGSRQREKGDNAKSSTLSPVGAHMEGEEEWVRVAIEAACPAVSLLLDSDAVIRRRACVILGNMAVVGGGDRALISADAPRQLLRIARGDSHHAVRQQAMATLCTIGQLDELQQALKSIDAGLKLHHASQGSSLPSNYRRPVSQLNGPNTGKT